MNFSQKIKEAIEEVVDGSVEVSLEHPVQESHGDYSSNIAMAMFSKLKVNPFDKLRTRIQKSKFNSPLGLAEDIKEKLTASNSLQAICDRVEVFAPGFINFWLSREALAREVEKILKEGERYGSSNEGEGKTIVVDYSGPNIAKRFSVGHLRSTIIGQAIVNLYKFQGWDVKGDNHLGDWGRQFGVLLYQIVSKGIEADSLTVDQMEELYVEFNKVAQENPDLWDEARLWFKKLEDGDSQARKTWTIVRDKTLLEFKRIYKLLDVEIDYAYGESFYEKIMPEVVKEAQEKGIAKMSQGALVIEFPDPSTGSGQVFPPAILRKSDEATNYFTRDLATIKFRLKEWNPDLIVYEVGSEQTLHFQQLFAAAEMLGWAKRDPSISSGRVAETRFVHVKHGLYLSPEGKKFSTRKGDIVHLEEILEEAIERAGTLGAQNAEVSEAVGVGAVKYFDLSHHPSSNIIFDWEKMMALEGNSAPYLQYTYARTKSVLSRANFQFTIFNFQSISQLNNEEVTLLRTIYKFPEVVGEAASSFSPNILANYLFDLAQKFNTFYSMHRVLDSDRQEDRLALTAAVGQILKNGLTLLGISAPEKM